MVVEDALTSFEGEALDERSAIRMDGEDIQKGLAGPLVPDVDARKEMPDGEALE